MYTPEQRQYLEEHQWAVLATGRADGSPQVSMVLYAVDGDDLLVSTKSFAAKWRNARRQPNVAVLVPDGRRQLVIYGTATGYDADPDRAELSADVWARMLGERPEPASIVAALDEQQRTVLRIAPERVSMND